MLPGVCLISEVSLAIYRTPSGEGGHRFHMSLWQKICNWWELLTEFDGFG